MDHLSHPNCCLRQELPLDERAMCSLLSVFLTFICSFVVCTACNDHKCYSIVFAVVKDELLPNNRCWEASEINFHQAPMEGRLSVWQVNFRALWASGSVN